LNEDWNLSSALLETQTKFIIEFTEATNLQLYRQKEIRKTEDELQKSKNDKQ
jgi:hypothetical protein